MFKTIIFVTLFLTVFHFTAYGQEPTPTPNASAAAEQRAALLDQIELLKAQQDYEKAKSELANIRLREIMNALPRDSSVKALDGTTTFKNAEKPSAETAALSYEALKELSAQIEAALAPRIATYSALVIYNEPDFDDLAGYRLYRSHLAVGIRNYETLVDRLADLDGPRPQGGVKIRTKSLDPVSTALSLPAIGTSLVRSAAEFMSMFRTDTEITESIDTIDDAALGTAMVNELRKRKPDLKIFYPLAFVPEYDLDAEGSDSVLQQVAAVNAAYTDVSDFLIRAEALPEDRRSASPLKEIIEFARLVQKQLQGLSLAGNPGDGGRNRTSSSDPESPRGPGSPLKQLMRAEKLDRFMRQGAPTIGSATGPRVGILKLRSLASGGSRRETRNLFLGNKISYSGGVTLEVLLFDVDGTLATSEIFSLHTGFRRMPTNKKQ